MTSVPVSVLSTTKNNRKRNFSNDASGRDDGDEVTVVSPQQRQHLEDKPPVIETPPVPVMDWEAAAKKDLPPENPMDWTTIKEPETTSIQEPMKLTEFESSLKLQPFTSTNSNAEINEQAPKGGSLTLSHEFSQKPLQGSMTQFQADKNVFNTSSTLDGSSVFVTNSGTQPTVNHNTQQSGKTFAFDGSSTSNLPSVTEATPTYPVGAVDSTVAYQNTSAASTAAYLTNQETSTAYQTTPVVSKVQYQAAPIVSTTPYQTAPQGPSTIYQATQAAPPVVNDVLQEFLPKPDDIQSNQSYLLKVANKVQTEEQQPVALNVQSVLSTPSANLVSAPFTGGKIQGESIPATNNSKLVPEYKSEYSNQSQSVAISQNNVTHSNESNNVSKPNEETAFTPFATDNLGIAPGQNTIQPMVTSDVQAPVSAFSSGTELPSAYGQNIAYKPMSAITNSLPVITLPAPITSTMVSSNSVYSTLPTTMAEVQTKMVVEPAPVFAGIQQQTGTTSVTVPREVGKSLFESTNNFTPQTGKNDFTTSAVVGDFPSQSSSNAFIQNSQPQLLGASVPNGAIFSATDAVAQKPFSNVVTVKSSEESSQPLQSSNIYSQPMAVPMAVDSFNGTAATATVNNANQLSTVQPMAFETTLPTAPSGLNSSTSTATIYPAEVATSNQQQTGFDSLILSAAPSAPANLTAANNSTSTTYQLGASDSSASVFATTINSNINTGFGDALIGRGMQQQDSSATSATLFNTSEAVSAAVAENNGCLTSAQSSPFAESVTSIGGAGEVIGSVNNSPFSAVVQSSLSPQDATIPVVGESSLVPATTQQNALGNCTASNTATASFMSNSTAANTATASFMSNSTAANTATASFMSNSTAANTATASFMSNSTAANTTTAPSTASTAMDYEITASNPAADSISNTTADPAANTVAGSSQQQTALGVTNAAAAEFAKVSRADMAMYDDESSVVPTAQIQPQHDPLLSETSAVIDVQKDIENAATLPTPPTSGTTGSDVINMVDQEWKDTSSDSLSAQWAT
eukprot:TRINITY_DN2292_c0_g1_i11.p1 TRINITY_DN2292_c0_g1~~TRINITY_DN2292_c0_g1_i11.p1  ORF type:complete len:1211 (-),score=259.24 TRINITY_DN2292_c0_g1_i11:648-3737(-)